MTSTHHTIPLRGPRGKLPFCGAAIHAYEPHAECPAPDSRSQVHFEQLKKRRAAQGPNLHLQRNTTTNPSPDLTPPPSQPATGSLVFCSASVAMASDAGAAAGFGGGEDEEEACAAAAAAAAIDMVVGVGVGLEISSTIRRSWFCDATPRCRRDAVRLAAINRRGTSGRGGGTHAVRLQADGGSCGAGAKKKNQNSRASPRPRRAATSCPPWRCASLCRQLQHRSHPFHHRL